jgi:hypothetical protein
MFAIVFKKTIHIKYTTLEDVKKLGKKIIKHKEKFKKLKERQI